MGAALLGEVSPLQRNAFPLDRGQEHGGWHLCCVGDGGCEFPSRHHRSAGRRTSGLQSIAAICAQTMRQIQVTGRAGLIHRLVHIARSAMPEVSRNGTTDSHSVYDGSEKGIRQAVTGVAVSLRKRACAIAGGEGAIPAGSIRQWIISAANGFRRINLRHRAGKGVRSAACNSSSRRRSIRRQPGIGVPARVAMSRR